jgi:hypothetical protein
MIKDSLIIITYTIAYCFIYTFLRNSIFSNNFLLRDFISYFVTFLYGIVLLSHSLHIIYGNRRYRSEN